MDNSLILNGYDLSDMVNEYGVTYEVITSKIVTTRDDIEHSLPPKYRVVIRVTLFPMSDSDTMSVFSTLSSYTFSAIYTDPYSGGSNRQQDVRLATNLSAAFSIKSINGTRYYNGSTLELRAISPGFGNIPDSESMLESEEL